MFDLIFTPPSSCTMNISYVFNKLVVRLLVVLLCAEKHNKWGLSCILDTVVPIMHLKSLNGDLK